MSAHDVIISLVYQVPAAAFILIALLTIVVPVGHLLIVVARALSGRETRVNWWVLGRAVPLVIAAAVVPVLVMASASWISPQQQALGEVVLIFLSAGVIFLPIALPILQAYAQRLPRYGTLVYSLLAILALPVAGALGTEAVIVTTRAVAQPSVVNAQPTAFRVDPNYSPCQVSVYRTLPEGFVSELPSADAPVRESYPAYFFFWLDMTFKAAFLDFFEVFECGVTNVRHNPEHLLTASFVFIYRSFVSVIVIAVLALPFARERG